MEFFILLQLVMQYSIYSAIVRPLLTVHNVHLAFHTFSRIFKWENVRKLPTNQLKNLRLPTEKTGFVRWQKCTHRARGCSRCGMTS